jgi:hypothetical protein
MKKNPMADARIVVAQYFSTPLLSFVRVFILIPLTWGQKVAETVFMFTHLSVLIVENLLSQLG